MNHELTGSSCFGRLLLGLFSRLLLLGAPPLVRRDVAFGMLHHPPSWRPPTSLDTVSTGCLDCFCFFFALFFAARDMPPVVVDASLFVMVMFEGK